MMTRPSSSSREALIAAVLDFLADQGLLTRQDIRAALGRELDGARPDANGRGRPDIYMSCRSVFRATADARYAIAATGAIEAPGIS